MNEHDHLYPYYLVHEKNSGRKADINPLHPETDFQAYTAGDELVFKIACKIRNAQEKGEISLLFDPAHSGRNPHNTVRITIKADGSLEYEEFRYEWESLDLPQGLRMAPFMEGDANDTELVIPLRLLHMESYEKRLIGFNLFRTVTDELNNPVVSKWSGLPGDVAFIGQGAGDLLFTKGLRQEEITQWINRSARESNEYFTKWEKRKIPDELHTYVTEKKKGYTIRMKEDDIRKAIENASNTEWGRQMKHGILKVADYWADKSDDELFDLVPVGNPRAMNVGQYFGNPLEQGNRTAFQVCLERPYQYYSPTTKTWWYNGMEIENPGTGETVSVQDDGGGFIAPDGFPHPGVRYMFTASYRLFILSMLMASPYCDVVEDREACPETTGKTYSGAINQLAYAYTLTKDKKYAKKALILAGRIAELLPYMNGNYGDGTFSDTVHISEPSTTESVWLSNYFEAVDLLYDVIDEMNPELQELYARKPDPENKTRTTPFCIKTALHEVIPYLIYSCELEKSKRSDWSMRYIHLELILASFMESGKLMQKVIYEGKYSLQSKMRNSFFRDGRYAYDSMHYIEIICDFTLQMANNNYQFKDETYFPEGIDMFEDHQFGLHEALKLLFQMKSGSLTAMFGDTQMDNDEPVSDTRKRGDFAYKATLDITYARMKSMRHVIGPLLGQYERSELVDHRVSQVNETYANQSFLLLATAPDWPELQRYKTGGKQIQSSILLEDSEISILRTGTNSHNCKHVILYGQPSGPHVHGDKLGLWIGAYGYHLLAGAGGYPFTWISPKFQAWETHSAACTVVVVDGKNQQHSYSNQKCHYEGRLMQVSGMENTEAYPGTHDERWCWVIEAPNQKDAYVVDLNYLQKGSTFDYNTVGFNASGKVDFSGISEEDWIPMQGTLAGPDISLYSKPGYGWMKALRKTKINHSVSWTYTYSDVGLKIHAVPDETDGERELICCLGESGGQEPGKSAWVPFVTWRDSSDDAENHAASFTSIMEPYENKSFIHSVQPMKLTESTMCSAFKPSGIEIRYKDQYKDILISTCGEGDWVRYQDSSGSEYASDAKALLLRYKKENLIEVEAVRYTHISAGSFQSIRKSSMIKGNIISVDVEERMIRVQLDSPLDTEPACLEGEVAIFESSDYVKSSTYYINKPQVDGNVLIFHSNISLIKLDYDWNYPEKRLGLGNKQVIDYKGKKVYLDLKPGDSFMLFNSLYQREDDLR